MSDVLWVMGTIFAVYLLVILYIWWAID